MPRSAIRTLRVAAAARVLLAGPARAQRVADLPGVAVRPAAIRGEHSGTPESMCGLAIRVFVVGGALPGGVIGFGLGGRRPTVP